MDKKVFDISDKINTEENSPHILPETEERDINYWRSFRELHNDPEFNKLKKNEFQNGSFADSGEGSISKFSRRKFFALLSASAAVAAAGCANPRKKGDIIPYNIKPEYVTIGNPNFYASTCTGCGDACGILIRTREGRPVKVDGNPDHPVSKGKICSIGQASVMSLYDPDRLKNPVQRNNRTSGTEINWADADNKIIEELRNSASTGKEIAVFANKINSPTLKKLLEEFIAAYPTTKIYSYDLFENTPKAAAWEKSYGTKAMPALKLDEAKIILALESDFLGSDPNSIEYSRMFAENRDVFGDKEFNRLYSIEGNASLTGFNSDYRVRLRTDRIENFVLSLTNELVNKEKVSKFANDASVSGKLGSYDLAAFIRENNLPEDVITYLVNDLKNNQGSSIVISGTMLPESTQIAVNLLNEVLGAANLYSTGESAVELIPYSSKQEIEALIGNMNSGNVGSVIHFDSNPVYTLPHGYSYDEALKNVPLVITMTEIENESSEMSDFVLPVNSMFESWGDYQTRNSFYSLQQPVIAPLYNTRQKEEILLTWLKGSSEAFNSDIYHQYLKQNWTGSIFSAIRTDANYDSAWFGALHDGIFLISGGVRNIISSGEETRVQSGTDTSAVQQDQNIQATQISQTSLSFRPDAFTVPANSQASDEFVLILERSQSLGDGRYANNGWLQELPHPVSKICWDNYAALSPGSAKELGIQNLDLIKITNSAGSLEVPVFIQPGVADKVIVIELGYGRAKAGEVGTGVGFDTNIFIDKDPVMTPWLYSGVKVEKASGSYELATTQEHYPIDNPRFNDIQMERHIIREGTYNQYKEDPDFLQKEIHDIDLQSINKTFKHTGVKWGMVVDMNKCTGCNECVVACNVENNIPVVGKEQVIKNREMMWLRIDRYYSGSPENPRASFQPMLCQHCDFAPCENVCPVAATTHTPDGINGMAYNRCVGTRYCSNNCPYKVRRFNYFNFRSHLADGYQQAESFSLMHNPEVTVRSRGVMEKCTFCLQRVMEERQIAIQENRPVKGSNVKTACQEACNTNAIVFGDQHEEGSELNEKMKSKLSYVVLEEIKVAPNVIYIAKLRNIHETSSAGDNH
jgi:MoCo/4Fe-4S cofactor protein with predicted Tat translocation signal